MSPPLFFVGGVDVNLDDNGWLDLHVFQRLARPLPEPARKDEGRPRVGSGARPQKMKEFSSVHRRERRRPPGDPQPTGGIGTSEYQGVGPMERAEHAADHRLGRPAGPHLLPRTAPRVVGRVELLRDDALDPGGGVADHPLRRNGAVRRHRHQDKAVREPAAERVETLDRISGNRFVTRYAYYHVDRQLQVAPGGAGTVCRHRRVTTGWMIHRVPAALTASSARPARIAAMYSS
jgi:hypothetical protein